MGRGLGVESLGRQGQEGRLESWIVFVLYPASTAGPLKRWIMIQSVYRIVEQVGDHTAGWGGSETGQRLGGCCIFVHGRDSVRAAVVKMVERQIPESLFR